MVLLPAQQVLFGKFKSISLYHTAKEKKKNHLFVELWYPNRTILLNRIQKK